MEQHHRLARTDAVHGKPCPVEAGKTFGLHSGTSMPTAFQRLVMLSVASLRWRGKALVSSHASCIDSHPACATGLKFDGSSKLPTVRSMSPLPSAQAKPSGVPQCEQNGRRAKIGRAHV